MKVFGLLYMLRVGTAILAGDTTDEEFCDSERGLCYTDFEVQVYRNGEHQDGLSAVIRKGACLDFWNVEASLGALFPAYCRPPEAPCKLYSEVGQAVNDCSNIDNKSSIYLVPQGRVFMWPTIELGHQVKVAHLEDTPNGEPVVVETLSHSPRIFRLHNLFSHTEADALIENALSIKTEAGRLKRSSTGAEGYNMNVHRTSHNAFDGTSVVAMALKRRSMALLGYPEFRDTWCDGAQVLRYAPGQAYRPHLDAFFGSDDGGGGGGHNYDAARGGTDRYATVLLYLSDVESGGETVFPHGRPPEGGPGALSTAQGPPPTGLFEPGSWEEEMVAQCQHCLAIRPRKGEAILFYSQHPNGRVDAASLHGGCPVLAGTKWAANFWFWNGPAAGYAATLANGTVIEVWDPSPRVVTFTNRDWPGAARLYWETSFVAELPVGQSLKVSTYIGHRWNLHLDSAEPSVQSVRIPHEDWYYEDGTQLQIVFRKEGPALSINLPRPPPPKM